MTRTRAGIVLLAVLLVVSGAVAKPPKPATPTPAAAAPTLLGLLKEAELDFTPRENGEVKIPVTIDGDTVMVVAREGAIGDGSPSLKLLHFYTTIVEIPKGTTPPAAMIKKIAELNDSLLVGKVSLTEDASGVFYSSSMWLQQANVRLLIQELALANLQRQKIRKTLQPFLQEG